MHKQAIWWQEFLACSLQEGTPSSSLRTQGSDLPYDDIHHIGQRVGDDQGGVDGQDSLQGLGCPHELPRGKVLNVLEGLELRVNLQGVSVATSDHGQVLDVFEGLEFRADLQGVSVLLDRDQSAKCLEGRGFGADLRGLLRAVRLSTQR